MDQGNANQSVKWTVGHTASALGQTNVNAMRDIKSRMGPAGQFAPKTVPRTAVARNLITVSVTKAIIKGRKICVNRSAQTAAQHMPDVCHQTNVNAFQAMRCQSNHVNQSAVRAAQMAIALRPRLVPAALVI